MKFKQIIDIQSPGELVGIDEDGHLVCIRFKASRSGTMEGTKIPCADIMYFSLDVLNIPGDYKSPPKNKEPR